MIECYCFLAFVASGLCLIFAYIFHWVAWPKRYLRMQGLDGPTPKSYLETLLAFRNPALINDLEDLQHMKEFGKIYGTINGQYLILNLAEPGLIKKILVDDAINFQSRKTSKVKNKILRDSLLSIEGKNNEAIKNILSNAFSTENIKKLIPKIRYSTECLIKVINLDIQAKKKITNFTQIVEDFMSKMLAYTIFSIDLDSDEEMKEKFENLVKELCNANKDNARVLGFLYQSFISSDDLFMKKESFQFLTSLCIKTIQSKRSASGNKLKTEDVLDLLLKAANEERNQVPKDKENVDDGNPEIVMNDEQIVTQIISAVIVMVDIFRATLVLALDTLAHEAVVEEKLYEELMQQIKIHNVVTYEMIENCKYLDMFLSEVLRMYPMEFRLERDCIGKMTLGKIDINTGIVVTVPVFAIHRCEEFFPEPDNFDPERFSEENVANRDKFVYLPFGQAGNDSSHFGIQFSLLAMKFVIASIVSGFKLTPFEGNSKVPVIKYGIPSTEGLPDILLQVAAK